MNLTDNEPFQPPSSEVRESSRFQTPSQLRITIGLGVCFALPILLADITIMALAEHFEKTEGMTDSVHNAFTAFFASLLVLGVAAVLTSISIPFKGPMNAKEIPKFALAHTVFWYLLHKLGWFVTLFFLYKRIFVYDGPIFFKFEFLLLLLIFTYVFLEIAIVRWRIKSNPMKG